MTIDYAPFSTAQAHLLDAAQWLQDLLLPHDHQERICADVAEGQRRAAREIELAICALTHKAAGSAALCILMIAGMLMDAQRRRKVNFLLDGQLHG